MNMLHVVLLLGALSSGAYAEAGPAGPNVTPSVVPNSKLATTTALPAAAPSPLPSAIPSAVTQPPPTPASAAPATGATVEHWNLRQAKALAYDHNPDLKSARANHEAASKAVGVAVSEYLPQVDFAARFEETTLPSPSAGLTDLLGTAEPYSSAVVAIRQLLFDFGKAINRIDASVSQKDAAEQNALAVRNAVSVAVERAFFNVTAAERLVDVALKGVDQFNETHRRTEVLVRTGARPSFDLSQANVELAKAKLGVVNARNARDLSRIALLNIMGLPQTTAFVLEDSGGQDQTTTKELDLDELQHKALNHRPELLRQGFDVQTAKYALQSTLRDYLPTIGLQAWYGKYLPNYPDSLRDAWGAGVGLSWNLFNGLGTTFRAGELGARVDQQEALFEKQRQDISAEVAADFMSLVQAEENLKLSDEAQAFAQENVRLAKKRYDASVGTILELLIAETSLVAAEAEDVQARYRHEIALAQLKIAVAAPLKGSE
jgi:outer membrane protein TolC